MGLTLVTLQENTTVLRKKLSSVAYLKKLLKFRRLELCNRTTNSTIHEYTLANHSSPAAPKS